MKKVVVYSFAVVFLAGIVSGIIKSQSLISSFTNIVSEVDSQVQSKFPKDAIISAKDGRVSTSINDPIQFEVPNELRKVPDFNNSNIKNLIVIYPNGTINDIDKYSTFYLINSANTLFKSGDQITTFPNTNFEDGQLTYEGVTKNIQNFKNAVMQKDVQMQLKVLASLFVAVIYIITLFIQIFFAASVAFISLLFIKKTPYKKAFRASLIAICFISIADIVFVILRISPPSGVITIVHMFLTSVVLFKEEKIKSFLKLPTKP